MTLLRTKHIDIEYHRVQDIIEDEELKKFYYELMISEAGHYVTFIEMARKYYDPEKVNKRWQEWLTYEAEVLKNMEIRGDRMH